MAADPDTATIKAAGGVVWRRSRAGGEVELAIIHRPRYDDWSLPKGKLDDGESWSQAALREVEEEIGLRCTLGEELPAVRYVDPKGRDKAVRYWLMTAETPAAFAPNDEVDELRWLVAGDALSRLSYDRDRRLVATALERLGAA